MDLELLKQLVDFLQVGGGWAISVILYFVVVYLFKQLKEANTEKSDLQQKNNDEIRSIALEATDVISANRIFLERIANQFEKQDTHNRENHDLMVETQAIIKQREKK